MALMEYYCMPADFDVSILEEDELYDDHAQLWDDLSEMLGGEVMPETYDTRTDSKCPACYAFSQTFPHSQTFRWSAGERRRC